jgi:hypothetical protein
MRRRNREVNIFNMSLLDILCGALGAFCFMMLSLFPDHAKVKDLQARLQAAERNSGDPSSASRTQQQLQQTQQQLQQAQKQLDQAKADQSLLWFRVAWETGQDVDMWIESAGGKMCSPKPQLIPPDRIGSGGTCKFVDQTKGPTYEQGWFKDVAYLNDGYRLFARLQNRNGVPGPVSVHGYMISRTPGQDGQVMNLADLGVVALNNERELVELGWIQFEKLGFTITRGAKPGGERPNVRLDSPSGVRFMPPAAPAAGNLQELERVDRWH